MSPYIAEFVGTAILCYLGDAVVANCVLDKTKGNNGGWVVITLGWACAVLIPAMMFGPASGAHFNPALTLGLAAIGSLAWSMVPGYIGCQILGGILGGVLVYINYKDHFDATSDQDAKLGVFCTGPAIRSLGANFISELLGTFMLVFAIVGIAQTTAADAGGVATFGVAAIIFSVGASLGGTTGYAINPARDLGPRIAHAILPIKDKRDSDWSYAWVPILGPVCGSVAAAFLASMLF